MEILTREKCPECNGCGMITNPIWQEFYAYDEKVKEKTGEYSTAAQCESWFIQKGRYKLPPEELECGECKGHGKIERWVDSKKIVPDTGII